MLPALDASKWVWTFVTAERRFRFELSGEVPTLMSSSYQGMASQKHPRSGLMHRFPTMRAFRLCERESRQPADRRRSFQAHLQLGRADLLPVERSRLYASQCSGIRTNTIVRRESPRFAEQKSWLLANHVPATSSAMPVPRKIVVVATEVFHLSFFLPHLLTQ